MQGQDEGPGGSGSESGVCQQCRLSKVRCDRVIPCTRCQRMDLECVPQSRGRGRPRVVKSEEGGGGGPGEGAGDWEGAGGHGNASGDASLGSGTATTARRPGRRMAPARSAAAGASSGLQQEQDGEPAGQGLRDRHRHQQQQRQEQHHVATMGYVAAAARGDEYDEEEEGAEAEEEEEMEGNAARQAEKEKGETGSRAKVKREGVQGGGGVNGGGASSSPSSSSSSSSLSSSSESSGNIAPLRYRKSERGRLLLAVTQAPLFGPVIAHAATGMLVAAINRVRVAGTLCQVKVHAFLRILGARAMRRPDDAGRELLETLSALLEVEDWAKHLFGPEALMPPLVPLRVESGLEAQGEEGGGEGTGGGGKGKGSDEGQALLSQPPQTEQQQRAPQQDSPPMPLREAERAQLAEVEARLKPLLLWTMADGVPYSYAVTTEGLTTIHASDDFTQLFLGGEEGRMAEANRQAVLPCFFWASRLIPVDQVGFLDALASNLLTSGGRERVSMVGKCVDGTGKVFLALIRYQLMMREGGRDAMEAFSCQRLPASPHVLPSSEEEEEEEGEDEDEKKEGRAKEEGGEERQVVLPAPEGSEGGGASGAGGGKGGNGGGGGGGGEGGRGGGGGGGRKGCIFPSFI